MELALALKFTFHPRTRHWRGVANAAAFLSKIQNYRQKNQFPCAQRRLWRDPRPHSALRKLPTPAQAADIYIANPYVKWFWRGISVLAWKSSFGVEFKFPPLVQGRKVFWDVQLRCRKRFFFSRKMSPGFLEALHVQLRCRRRFFLQRNGPWIFGSPSCPTTLPQAHFFSRKMAPQFLEAPS